MINIKRKSECTGCSACKNICPKNAIEMVCDNEGFEYPIVDKNKCVNCNLCNKVCPVLNVKECKDENQIINIAYNCNKEEVEKSSSGGIFILLAKKTIENGGVVYGAAFDEKLVLRHTSADKYEKIEPLLKSKYVQSAIGDSYIKVKNDLKKGRKVLFVGTPCQVNGLLSFLNKKYDNLITVDFICHGVPSGKVLHHYVSCLEKKYHSSITKIFFRTKTKGWNNFGLKFLFENGKCIEKFGIEDEYLAAFLFDIDLRPSCYKCNFKGIDRKSDITLADAWGELSGSRVYNERGTSLIIAHTNDGEKLIDEITKNIEFERNKENYILKYNVNAMYSVIKDSRRKKFFKQLNNNRDFMEIVNKLKKITFRVRVERKIRKIVNGRRNKKIS